MCMFTYPTVEVADTSIFARLENDGRQVLAYQMTLQAAEDLAMVLPIPIGSRDESRALEFISLEHCTDFFERLARQLPVWQAPEGDPNLLGTLDDTAVATRPRLKVHRVGDYEASFLPSLAEFDRLDPRFRLAPDVWQILTDYRDWGFAVFKLRNFRDKSRPAHAMAFRFVTRFPDAMFFPTVHVHDGRVHALAGFDHLMYFQATFDRGRGDAGFINGRQVAGDEAQLAITRAGWTFDACEFADLNPARPSYGAIQWARDSGDNPPGKGDVDCAQGLLDARIPLHAFGMRGVLPNRDTWFYLDAPWR